MNDGPIGVEQPGPGEPGTGPPDPPADDTPAPAASIEPGTDPHDLERAEGRFRALVEATGMAVWSWVPATGSGDLAAAQRWWEGLTGQEPRDQTDRAGTGWLAMVHPEDRKRVRTAWIALERDGSNLFVEFRVRRRDATWGHVRNQVVPVRGPDGAVVEWVGTLCNVTDERRAEERIRASEGLFRRMADATPVLIRMSGPDGRCGFVNRPWLDFTGRDPDQELGDGWSTSVHPEDRAACLGESRAAFDARRPFRMEYRLRRSDGEYRWVVDNGLPIHGPGGEFGGYIDSCIDVTERRHAVESLRASNRRKDDFLAILAHELRNPLAPVRNALHILHLKGDEPALAEQARAMIERQVTHLARLLDELLDVSRITRGKIVLKRERIELSRAVRQAVEDRRPLFERAGLTLRVRVPDIPVWVNGDRTRLVQMVENLLDNAQKFTERGGSVDVDVTVETAPVPSAGQAILRVRDDGIGIEREVLQDLFEALTQADLSLDRRHGGLGLGLALVKGLAALHGGSLDARSEGPGRGSEFTVKLPLEGEPAALRPGAGTTRRLVPAPLDRDRLRVLVVEDNLDAADSLRLLLEASGYDVLVAHNGQDGVRTAMQTHPKVIVCDIGLPGMDGYAVARAIRASESAARTRLIAVTGYGQEEERARALESGFDEHLTKPADPERLLSLVGA